MNHYSKLFYLGKFIRVLNPFHYLLHVLYVRMEVLYPGVEYVWQAFLPHKMVRKHPDALLYLVLLSVLTPHLSQVMNRVDFAFELFHSHHKLHEIYLELRKQLFDLACVFLNVG
jgi:hypothetical protein